MPHAIIIIINVIIIITYYYSYIIFTTFCFRSIWRISPQSFARDQVWLAMKLQVEPTTPSPLRRITSYLLRTAQVMLSRFSASGCHRGRTHFRTEFSRQSVAWRESGIRFAGSLTFRWAQTWICPKRSGLSALRPLKHSNCHLVTNRLNGEWH